MNDQSARGMLLADQSFLAFRDLLFRGEVRAGQLVSISELMEKTGFPLAPVREAVKHAESTGLVRILPKRGVLIIEPTPDTVRSCFHLRCMLDQEGARILAARLVEAPMQALREEHAAVRNQALEGITPELQQWAMAVDWKLHRALAGSLDNPLAAQVYASNHDRITVLQQSRRLLPERIIPAMDEHLRIIDAVLAGREEDAMRAVRAHLAGTLRWWGIGLSEV
ncbi:GntR family transcriptional regulator [Castellaniella ginsengisoli]|uniref:GntR family transcriptional regulator n=1 Tax=Castellaniella ginsengisoli TaxID=546114 RepID=A0ABP3W4S3_9BURK